MKKGLLFLLVMIGFWGAYACSDNKDKNSPKQPPQPRQSQSVNAQKIVLIELTETGISEFLKKRMSSEMAANGLVENRDYIIKAKTALGDNASLISLIDAARKEKPDLLITFQPQTLYTSIRKAPELKIVFGIITDPFILGGGKSDKEHLPNLTGFYMDMADDKLAAFIKSLNPAPRTLGLLYLSGEDDSVKRMEAMTRALGRYGIKVIAQNYTTQSEISTAANVLFNHKLDGVIKLAGCYESLVLASLMPLARKAKIPVYSQGLSKDNIETSLSARFDYDHVARIFWKMVARALKGEDLAKIPFESSRDVKLTFRINKKDFDAYGIKIPEEALKEAVLVP